MSRQTSPDAVGPLADLRVLEVSTGSAGRIAGMLLADLGADVVQVVPGPQWTPVLPADVCWGRGKRQVQASDPKVLELAIHADVVIVNTTPADTRQRGLSSEDLQAVAPEAIHVWVPPYGETGESSDLPDDGLVLAALTCLAVNLPADDASPVAPVVSTLSMIHGALAACAAVAGVLGKRRFGVSQPAVVSGLHAGAALMGPVFAELNDEAAFAPSRAIVPAPNWRPYLCADGKRIFMATLLPHLFERALRAIDRLDIMALPEVAGDFKSILDVRRGRIRVTRELEPIFLTRTAQEWLDLFGQARVPCALVQTRAEWMTGPIVAANDARIELEHPTLGRVSMPNVPIAFSATPGRIRGLLEEVSPDSVRWTRREVSAAAAQDAAVRLPLDGLRVLDVSSYFAAPLAGSILADFGADVVRVEPPTGDPYRAYPLAFLAVNQRKRGLALDLADPGTRSELHTVLPRMDVLIENMRPDIRQRLELVDTGTRYPQLVHLSVSAFGRAEGLANLPGFDPVMQSLSGFSTAQGGEDGPVTTSAGVTDAGTGVLSALGVLAALYLREQTRGGQRVWTSLAVSSTFLQASEFCSWPGSPEPQQGRQLFRGPAEGHRYYECADGWIATVATDGPSRSSMLAVLGRADFAAAAQLLRELPVARAVEQLSRGGVPACRVVPRTRPLLDPYLQANEFSQLVSVPGGTARIVDHLSRWPAAPARRPARYFDPGQDSAAIRHEFAFGVGHDAEGDISTSEGSR